VAREAAAIVHALCRLAVDWPGVPLVCMFMRRQTGPDKHRIDKGKRGKTEFERIREATQPDLT